MLVAMPSSVPAAAKRFRVVVIERAALKALCQVLAADPALEVVGDADSIPNAALARTRPDLIVLDVDGIQGELSEAMRMCAEEAPGAKVCVISSHVQPEVMQRCMSVGVEGYIVKDILPADLVRAVKLVAGAGLCRSPRRRRSPPPAQVDVRARRAHRTLDA
jgi:DNA-binding NarL/FixJ family response regulator